MKPPQNEVSTMTRRGRIAEARAARFLAVLGYVVVEKNRTCRQGEIDLVCFEGAVLCFVEVRARRDARFGGGAASVDRHKQRRLVDAARHYLADYSGPPPCCRFDVVELYGPSHEHVCLYRGAFEVTS